MQVQPRARTIALGSLGIPGIIGIGALGAAAGAGVLTTCGDETGMRLGWGWVGWWVAGESGVEGGAEMR